MSQDQYTQQDPTQQHATPGSGDKTIEHPGRTADMDVTPDHGEQTYRGSGRLEGKKTVITGGDSGIGRAVAIAFAREGADVLISYLPDEEKDAQETVRLIEEAGRRAVTVPGDIRDQQVCRQIIRRALDDLGGLDILVNNAAYQMTREGIEQIPDGEWEHTFKTNIFAMYYLCKAAWPHLQPGSAIVNTASIQAYQPSPQLLPYASTKGAIVTFSKALAEEGAEKGIRVNVVAPGPIWTPLIPATMPEEKAQKFGQDTPLGRPGQPAELAPLFVFLASDESRYITGEVVGVTGGKPLA